MGYDNSETMSKALYAAYITGSVGSTVALFYIGDGQIIGIDAGTMKYDGVFQIKPDGSYQGILSYIPPKETLLVTGGSQSSNTKIEMPFSLPNGFWEGQVIRMPTPLGVVNVKFEKLKELK
jgi:hypothetical protein